MEQEEGQGMHQVIIFSKESATSLQNRRNKGIVCSVRNLFSNFFFVKTGTLARNLRIKSALFKQNCEFSQIQNWI